MVLIIPAAQGKCKHEQLAPENSRFPFAPLCGILTLIQPKGGITLYRILIVEDDPAIAGAICAHIASWGMQAKAACDFMNVMREFSEFDPHLVLLDVALPFYSGFHWCQEIRKVSKVPLMFISSAGDSMNIVMAMTLGADNFIAKPFDLSVLSAKVQALLRRAYDFSGQTQVLSHRELLLSRADNFITYQGKKLALTRNEYRILLTLMEKCGQIVSRETLMERLWETDSFVDENTLTVNVTRLRKKLSELGLEGFIATRKGQGYIIE